jgi:Uma2 family endonuclease
MFEGRRAMLIDGVILEQGQMNPPHANALELIDPVIQMVFGAGWRIRRQSPMVLGLETDPMPDFAVIQGRPSANAAHPTTAELVIEVADSSLGYDTNEKRLLYARAGIKEYWVVDINGRRLLVYRDPQAGDYAIRHVYGSADVVSPVAAPAATVKVADLLA